MEDMTALHEKANKKSKSSLEKGDDITIVLPLETEALPKSKSGYPPSRGSSSMCQGFRPLRNTQIGTLKRSYELQRLTEF